MTSPSRLATERISRRPSKRSRASFSMRQIELEVIDTDAVVKADRILTLFMLNTLADNARKFTPQGGRVTIKAQEDSSSVEIEVSDTGQGIPKKQLENIFNHKVHGGHGFGLMNCKGIINQYRKVSQLFSVCTIGAESQVGKGSRFFFRLPSGVARGRSSVLTRSFLLGTLLTFFSGISFSSMASQTTDVVRSPQDPSVFVDSVYQCNVTDRYAEALVFARQALSSLNACYLETYPDGKDTLCVIAQNILQPADLRWFRDSIQVDYSMLLFLRNEMAVAALTQHDWELYRYNNSIYTQLFKELSADHTLGTYVEQMQQSEQNKNVAVILLILLLGILLIAYYMLYYRHRLYFHFCVERIEEINAMLLDDNTGKDIKNSPRQQLIALDAFLHSHETEPLPSELQSIVDEIRQTLQQAAESDEHHRLTLEMAQDQLRQAEYENQKLYVANNVIDNCLSALKHETMYYPSRIAQLVGQLKDNSEETSTLQQLSEVASYYRELHALLAEQAMRQMADVRLHVVPLELSVLGIPSDGTIAVVGDQLMLKYLIELIGRLSNQKTFSSEISEKAPKYVIVKVTMPNLPYRDFFTPSLENIPILIARQIVRDHSEANHLRGCGVVATPFNNDGSLFVVTLPKSRAS